MLWCVIALRSCRVRTVVARLRIFSAIEVEFCPQIIPLPRWGILLRRDDAAAEVCDE